jgi:hypothetical protein
MAVFAYLKSGLKRSGNPCRRFSNLAPKGLLLGTPREYLISEVTPLEYQLK